MKQKPLPMKNKIKIVNLDGIVIFLNENVGNLLINSILRLITIKVWCNFFNIRSLLQNLIIQKLEEIDIINPPAGEGTPSKKFCFHDSSSLKDVKLNLANLITQQTE